MVHISLLVHDFDVALIPGSNSNYAQIETRVVGFLGVPALKTPISQVDLDFQQQINIGSPWTPAIVSMQHITFTDISGSATKTQSLDPWIWSKLLPGTDDACAEPRFH